MQRAAADRMLALMEEIAADYEALDARDRPDLFATPSSQSMSSPQEISMPRADPTFGKTPGMNIEREGQKRSTCRCGESILTGLVRDALNGTLNHRVFDAQPLSHNGQNYYTRHRCDLNRR